MNVKYESQECHGSKQTSQRSLAVPASPDLLSDDLLVCRAAPEKSELNDETADLDNKDPVKPNFRGFLPGEPASLDNLAELICCLLGLEML